MLPQIGHLHLTYKPKHTQLPVNLWGQTGLYAAFVKTFEL